MKTEIQYSETNTDFKTTKNRVFFTTIIYIYSVQRRRHSRLNILSSFRYYFAVQWRNDCNFTLAPNNNYLYNNNKWEKKIKYEIRNEFFTIVFLYE